ncbi:ZIP family metal transporter [Anaeromyxobacter paludicola]|uniref:Iron permease n=1 Tax=Anaeromyxobacter paludicola TaxID=2918171 RepID=A0ABM7XEH0_9BACT|nr:ZIP family metal transporter [Anaeromyxobacter paludicola]BDG10280.1 iron permease [Anaeromyxobacter paludicola]
MTELGTLALYAGAILAGSLAGGVLPLLGGVRRSDPLLAFSAGVMLGAAFFHMLPEAVEGVGILRALPFVAVGFLCLFALERWVLVHVCDPGGAAAALEPSGAGEEIGLPADTGLVGAAHPHAHAHVHSHEHPRPGGAGCDVHTMGLAAFVGLSLHTLIDGFALGAANERAALGLMVFVAILAHKIPSSFSLSAILRAEGWSRRRALAMNAAFALMVPAGAVLYVAARDLFGLQAFTPLALAASCGTFLHLSLSDILPDLHRRGGPRVKLALALAAGVALMWALRHLHHE